MLVFDEDSSYEIPRNFRTTRDPFLPNQEIQMLPSRLGLYELQAVASAQFSERTLKNALPKLQGNVWIVDLRRESHGFVNGLPISWFAPHNSTNLGLSATEILQKEAKMIGDLKAENPLWVQRITNKKMGVIQETQPVEVVISNLETEETLAHQLKLGYSRFVVQDHFRPDDETVDQFINLVKSLKPNTWLYIHCRAGKGRSTSFMVIYDMLKNAKTVPLDEILLRQKMLGGSNFLHISNKPESLWKREPALERKAFLEDFYRYAADPEGFPKKSWSEWLKQE
ncbi:fused DSP-PTPase phosphatase/NAD kinase-like protein [Candidatus Berkiella aquae]|nr:hypothetical protein [Candidatus Berkiella aquae]MCS5710896.1 hypothetical protein [Candidatus Berkiella aquae]